MMTMGPPSAKEREPLFSVVLLPHTANTHPLYVPKEEITAYRSTCQTLIPAFPILVFLAFDCASGERTSSPFFAHSSHRTSHIPYSALPPFPSVGLLQPPTAQSHSTSPVLQASSFSRPLSYNTHLIRSPSAGLPASITRNKT
jgi:hypothetical protein